MADPTITSNNAEITPQEIKYLWKRIDRKLKISPSDSEISGMANMLIQSPDNIPLQLYGLDDKINALGAVSVNELIGHIYQQEERVGERRLRYNRLQEAQKHPEIVGVLNIHADEATTEDQDGEILHVVHPKEEVVELLDKMYSRLGINDKAWGIVKDMCGYGDDFWEVVISQSLKRILKLIHLPRQFILRVEKNGDLLGFEVSDVEMRDTNTLSYFAYTVNYQTEYEKENKRFYPFRMLHFKIPSSQYGIYGEAVIDSVLSSIEMISMMEKSLLIARITRAPERRIFNINVGTLQGESAMKYAKQVMDNFRNKRKLDIYSKNKIDYQRDIFGTVEDIVIPKRAGDEGHSITTLDQLNNPGDVGDLEFIRDKIFPGVGVPRQYLYDDTFANANTNLSSKSKPFAKKIRRIQRCFLYQMYKLAYIELRLNGYSSREFDELVLTMNNPSNIDEKERIEIETSRWGLIMNMKSLNAESVFIPDYKIYQDVLKLSDEEIVEWLKLAQLQQAGKNIFEALPEEERPEGSEDLAEMTPPPAEGEGAPGGGAPAGGGAPPTPAGGEAGAPGAPAGGEEGTAPGPAPIPPEVAGQLGPAPETAEYVPMFSIDKKQNYSEALQKKNKLVTMINEMVE